MKNISPLIEDLIPFSLTNINEKYSAEISTLSSMLKKRRGDLLTQINLADTIRNDHVGNYVSFVINQNINFSQYCIGSCSFCSYKKTPTKESSLAPSFSLDFLKEETKKAIARNATEICLQGGLDPALTFEYYLDMIKAIRSISPKIHIHAFSPSEIAFMSQISGEKVEIIFKELKQKGLNSFPGTAAEILVDKIRRIICPDKISTNQWLNIVLAGHQVGLKSSATMMYGHIESTLDQAEHLLKLKLLQEESNGFTEFVPLPFIHVNTPLYRFMGAKPGSSGDQDLALFSTARLYLGETIPNLQASWVKLGPKFAQFSLNSGVNDLGGTLFVETISKSAGANYGELLTPEEFIALIRDADKIPVQRDTLYNTLEFYK